MQCSILGPIWECCALPFSGMLLWQQIEEEHMDIAVSASWTPAKTNKYIKNMYFAIPCLIAELGIYLQRGKEEKVLLE